MKRFWVSWKSGYYWDEGCIEPPIQIWVSGSSSRHDNSDRDILNICAVIDDLDEETIKTKLLKYFPDLEMRFCNEEAYDYMPNNRFPNFENRTIL